MNYFDLFEIESEEQQLNTIFPLDIEIISKNKQISLPFYLLDFLIENEHCQIVLPSKTEINAYKANFLKNLSKIKFDSENECKYFFRFYEKLSNINKIKNEIVDREVFSLFDMLMARIQRNAIKLFDFDLCIKGQSFESAVIKGNTDVDFSKVDFSKDYKQINISEENYILDKDEKEVFELSKKSFVFFRMY